SPFERRPHHPLGGDCRTEPLDDVAIVVVVRWLDEHETELAPLHPGVRIIKESGRPGRSCRASRPATKKATARDARSLRAGRPLSTATWWWPRGDSNTRQTA